MTSDFVFGSCLFERVNNFKQIFKLQQGPTKSVIVFFTFFGWLIFGVHDFVDFCCMPAWHPKMGPSRILGVVYSEFLPSLAWEHYQPSIEHHFYGNVFGTFLWKKNIKHSNHESSSQEGSLHSFPGFIWHDYNVENAWGREQSAGASTMTSVGDPNNSVVFWLSNRFDEY